MPTDISPDDPDLAFCEGDCSCVAVGPDQWARDPECPRHGTDIHTWFSLSYANYLVLPRSFLQSMPIRWQVRFVKMLTELERAAENAGVKTAHCYDVRARGDDGRYMRDPAPHYDRGRTQIEGMEKSP